MLRQVVEPLPGETGDTSVKRGANSFRYPIPNGNLTTKAKMPLPAMGNGFIGSD